MQVNYVEEELEVRKLIAFADQHIADQDKFTINGAPSWDRLVHLAETDTTNIDMLLGGRHGAEIGHGVFSKVYIAPWDKTKVIKWGRGHAGDGDIYGDGWLHYAVFCMEKKLDGNHNPLLLDVNRLYISKNRQWFFALMDRYDRTWHNLKSEGSPSKLQLQRIRALQLIMGDQNGRPRKEKSDFDPEYLQYAALLFTDDQFKVNDLHGGNIMFQGDRVIVTDPFASGSRTNKIVTSLKALSILPDDEPVPNAGIRVPPIEFMPKQAWMNEPVFFIDDINDRGGPQVKLVPPAKNSWDVMALKMAERHLHLPDGRPKPMWMQEQIKNGRKLNKLNKR